MEYTEEVIKEADSVVDKYLHVFPISDMLRKWHSTRCAIQDRQSVISFAKNIKLKLFNVCTVNEHGISITIEEEIKSLTKQIDYLKSKI